MGSAARRAEMIGRRVKPFQGNPGEIVKWEPLSAAMCDVLVRDDDGHECWFASHCCRPIDGLGDLPSRQDAQECARQRSLADLRVILDNHVRDFNKPWPGCEFGKAIVGNAIVGAIRELEKGEV
jgi:hypothetical protein